MPVCAELLLRNVPNIPGQGPSSGEYFMSTPQGGFIYPSTRNGVDAGYGDAYPQLPASSWPQPGIGYGVSSRSPPIQRSPHPTTYQPYPVQPAYVAHSPRLSDVSHRRNPVAAIATGSRCQGSAFVQDALGRPYYQQWYPILPFLAAVIDEQQDFEQHRLLLTRQHSSAYVHTLAYFLVVISIDTFTPTELPVQPQRFTLTDEHSLPPQMPNARLHFGGRGKRRALIVRGRRTDTTR